MVRVFVSPSHLCTLYMIMYAKQTARPEFKDVLILDTPPKKQSLIDAISETKNIYPWAEVINLATTLSNEADFTPSTRKNITRKIKGNLFVKPFYDLLLKLYLARQRNKEQKVVRSKLSGLGMVEEINLVTQTAINTTMFTLYPKASINYFEHGQGDYLYIQKVKPVNFTFYCVFADRFKDYLARHKQENSYVKDLDRTDFILLANSSLAKDAHVREIESLVKKENKLVLILLENMQVYNVPDNFWTDYLDLCIEQIDNPEEYTFILKPHPGQSFKSIEISKQHMLTKRKLNVLVLENSSAISYSVEVLYALWKDNTRYVFCVFSSALFYISNLYGSEQTKYFYAYEFFKQYIKDAPSQISLNYYNFEGLLKNVFTENCIEMPKQRSS